MRIDVAALWQGDCRRNGGQNEHLERIQTGIFDLVSELAKCERLPEIEIVVRLENVAPWIMGQPDIYPSEDDAFALVGPFFSLGKPRDAAEVQGALVVPSDIVNARERWAALSVRMTLYGRCGRGTWS